MKKLMIGLNKFFIKKCGRLIFLGKFLCTRPFFLLKKRGHCLISGSLWLLGCQKESSQLVFFSIYYCCYYDYEIVLEFSLKTVSSRTRLIMLIAPLTLNIV